MKKWFKKLAVLLALAIIVTSIDYPITAKATGETPDLGDLENVTNTSGEFPQTDEAYNSIMSAANGGTFFITSQPASALVLRDVVTLNEDMLSPNYEIGVVDLPRLSASYYYAFSGNQTSFYLGNTVYPTLCWTDSAKGQSATLCIYERNTNSVVYSCQIINSDLFGVSMTDMEDASKVIVTGLLDAGSNARKYTHSATIYDPALHKTSIVMPQYIYTPDITYSTLDGIAYDNVNIANESYVFKRMTMTPAGITSHYNVKDYMEYFSRNPRAALLFAGSKFEDCSFDCNTGEVTTKVTSTDIDDLYFFIATQDKCYFSVVSTDSIPNEDALTVADADAPKKTWVSSNSYSVLYNSETNPDYPDFGPVSYDEWFQYAANTCNVTTMSGKYGFVFQSTSSINDVNLYARALMYAGIEPHVATLDLKKQSRQVQLEYMVMTPDDTKFNLVKTESFDADDFSFDSLMQLDNINKYVPTVWCIDAECTKPFEENATIDPTANTKYTIYAMYRWSGGKYSVTYYNDVNNTQMTQTYNLDEKPILPAVPDAQPGYGFRNWYIVDNTLSADGTPYVADDFTPTENTTYIFKTMWDVKGIITQVLTNKLTYYVGDKVDKTLLDVYVQYDNAGNTRILEQDEFVLEEETIDKAGVNQFWVVYPETNARGMCEITGLTVAPMSLNVNYLGGDTMVGTNLTNSNFRVELTYNNGKSELINQFTMLPTTISTIGTNNITISYGSLSTTVQIKGISVENPTGAEVRSITATFVGNKPKVNQSISAKDILVVAEYSDGTTRTISSDQYQYTPDKFASSGKQRITVVFGGRNTTCDVEVEAVNASTSGGQSNSNSNSNTPNKTTQTSNKTTSTTTQSRPTNSTSTSSSSNNRTNNTTNSSSNNNSTGGTNSDNKESTPASDSSILDLAALFGQEVESTTSSGTSIGYMHGANILTNVMRSGGADAVINEVDILQMITDAGDNISSLTINLINGASGNDITPEMLELLQSKTLSLYINMLSPVNDEVVVGRWIIVGGQLDSIDATINPNITYETFDKPSDRLLAVSLNNTTYPKGVSITAYPAVETYGSGQLIRLYSCSVTREHAKMVRTFPWQDSANALELDPYSSIYYCLSDAMEAYEDDADLNLNLNEVSLEDEPGTETIEPDDTVPEDFWDDDTTPAPIPVKRSFPTWIFIVLGVAGLLLLLLIIVMVIVIAKRNGGKRNDDFDDTVAYDSDNTEFDIPEDGHIESYDDVMTDNESEE